jgi:ribose transport system substrate-binding protein
MHGDHRHSFLFNFHYVALVAVLMLLVAPVSMVAAQDATAVANPFDDQAEFERQLALQQMTPIGPADQPWLQMIDPELIDTSEYKAETAGDWHLCFSNAGLGNAWRKTGFTTMNEEVKLHPEIASFTVTDAGSDDATQIDDIEGLLTQDCDALIVSPNTNAALTPAVEAACQQIPVVVFDRGVGTNCPATFIHPIGGYAYGADGASFIADKAGAGGKVLVLRSLPGVDVLENRWAAAGHIFAERGVDVVGVEFTQGDDAIVQQIVMEYVQREGELDGIWFDAGHNALGAIAAYEALGLPVPPIVGEDQNDFLLTWKAKDLTAIAPVYSNFQWRTAVIAATMILAGESVPAEWILPQTPITQETLDANLYPNMPGSWYATCGCQDMAAFPEAWGGTNP